MTGKLQQQYRAWVEEIIQLMQSCGDGWQMPWHGEVRVPINIARGEPYGGLNRLILMCRQQKDDYLSHQWGTLRQWNSRGSRVIRGEKAVTLYMPVMEKLRSGQEEAVGFRPFWVFNGDQVTNHNPDHPDLFSEALNGEVFDHKEIEQLVLAHKVRISYGGDRAVYFIKQDRIAMPSRAQFFGSKTSSAEEAYYATLLHELVHWTGNDSRTKRLADDDGSKEHYAFEELVAELGAAFLCADFTVTNEPRLDHAQYLNSWIQVLSNDYRKLWRAASLAQKAVDYLLERDAPLAEPARDYRKPPAFELEIQPTQPELL